MRRPTSLAARLMVAQLLVIATGALTLVVATALVAPALFAEHLTRTGEDSPQVKQHAEEAFASSFAISLTLAMVAALTAAGLVSWFLVRRVAHPVVELADAADAVAAGDYAVRVPAGGFGSELTRLSEAFDHMANRLAATDAARTSMLADLAHELRTPLATLEAYIDGMEDHVVPSGAPSYAVMRDQVARLRRLAGDLKEAAAAEEHALGLVLTPVDPVAIARDALAAARPGYQNKAVDLLLADPGDCPLVRADAERLQQVLANLLDNALRHTPAGGRVEVSIGEGGGKSVRVTVTDNGDGIEPAQLDDVFERFYRADPARAVHDGGGSGLGLTIARAIAEDHGGSLTAASRGAGTGSTLTLTLPAVGTRPPAGP
jgi:two-component system sensor histidine kinase BaeS